MAAGVLALVPAGCGGQGEPDSSSSRASAWPEPAAARDPAAKSLAMGITEPNPNFIWPSGHAVPEPFAHWRDELDELRPSHYRLVIDWPAIQPQLGTPPDLDRVAGGCGRRGPPCAAWGGVREQLRALAARQRSDPRAWQALVVLDGTPDWAGRTADGCLDEASGARARPLSAEGEAGMRDLVGTILRTAQDEGADLHWWSARNEPNHPSFLAPQRSRCSARAPSVSVEPYVKMTQALRAALAAAPGAQEYTLGELAAADERSPRTTSVREFIRALPRELVCGTGVWAQHGYVGGTDAIGQATAELRRFDCPKPHEVWITETGVGGALVGRSRAATAGDAARDCRALRRQLLRWYADPQVTVAIQYTLREDDVFPTGLVDSGLTHAYPALAEWQAWGTGARPRPTDAPPPSACR